MEISDWWQGFACGLSAGTASGVLWLVFMLWRHRPRRVAPTPDPSLCPNCRVRLRVVLENAVVKFHHRYSRPEQRCDVSQCPRCGTMYAGGVFAGGLICTDEHSRTVKDVDAEEALRIDRGGANG